MLLNTGVDQIDTIKQNPQQLELFDDDVMESVAQTNKKASELVATENQKVEDKRRKQQEIEDALQRSMKKIKQIFKYSPLFLYLRVYMIK